MLTLDTLVTAGIVVGAAVYLYRKFSKSRKSGGCGGCGGSSGAGCCSTNDAAVEAHCSPSKH